jgi:hypothetical protein
MSPPFKQPPPLCCGHHQGDALRREAQVPGQVGGGLSRLMVELPEDADYRSCQSVELLGPSEVATARPIEHNGRGRVLSPGEQR